MFNVAAAAQFFSNGVSFAGQMLIPLFLIEACGQSTAAMGWLPAPLGLGMMVTYLSLGAPVARVGRRAVALAGAALALAGTLALAWQAGPPLFLRLLLPALFLCGIGQGRARARDRVACKQLNAVYAARMRLGGVPSLTQGISEMSNTPLRFASGQFLA